jgi:hypothetical protein
VGAADPDGAAEGAGLWSIDGAGFADAAGAVEGGEDAPAAAVGAYVHAGPFPVGAQAATTAPATTPPPARAAVRRNDRRVRGEG